MARQKNDGRGRLGGRTKGTPNKVTSDLRKWIKDLLLKDTAKFEKALRGLSPQEYTQTYLRLINYIVPKQKPIEPKEYEEEKRSKLDMLRAKIEGDLDDELDDDLDDDELDLSYEEWYEKHYNDDGTEFISRHSEGYEDGREWYRKGYEERRRLRLKIQELEGELQHEREKNTTSETTE